MNKDSHPILHPAITTAWLLRHAIAPLKFRPDGTLEVAAAEPVDRLAIDVIAALLNRPVAVKGENVAAVRNKLMDRAAEQRETASQLTGDQSKTRAEKGLTREDSSPHADNAVVTGVSVSRLAAGELLGGDPEEPTVIRVVNAILADAVNLAASDIHLEPVGEGLKIRFRIDGLLEDRDMLPDAFREPVVSRIKVMARLDISNRRQPQDGAFDVTFGGHPLDVRVSTIPTPAGQRVVMRLLDRSGRAVTLKKLGMDADLIDSIQSVLNRTQGLFLIAGPTGSGKTTTLYACLNRLDIGVRNTITIEDPVEYHVSGISQVQVGRDRTLGFADGLRSILRQDPDVIMVGEIRDADTASTALQAALTGHLILSTIHTMDPAAAVIRLLDLGVEPPLIAETLVALMDQRLVRTLCPHCSDPAGRNGERIATGCSRCRNSGYLGRIGLFRYLAMDSEMKAAIRANDHQRIRDMVDAGCGNRLLEQADALVAAGRTTREEILRVIQPGG